MALQGLTLPAVAEGFLGSVQRWLVKLASSESEPTDLDILSTTECLDTALFSNSKMLA